MTYGPFLLSLWVLQQNIMEITPRNPENACLYKQALLSGSGADSVIKLKTEKKNLVFAIQKWV